MKRSLNIRKSNKTHRKSERLERGTKSIEKQHQIKTTKPNK